MKADPTEPQQAPPPGEAPRGVLPLEDLVVLDLSHALAGPIASTVLGDFGARVVKVENPKGGDIARQWGPPFHGDDAAYFVNLHRNKQSVTIDLKDPEGRELFLRLAERADVVLENLRPGAVDRLGVGWADVSARNPRLVYCSISGYGQDGPYRDRAGMDLMLQAESGMMSLTGEPGRTPVRAGVSIADLQAGMHAVIAILIALHARRRTGRGQLVDISMLEGQLALLDHVLGMYLADREPLGRMGTAYKTIVPYQTFRTRTEDVAIAVGSDSLWRSFCAAVGLPELAGDPRYATNPARNDHRDELVARLQEAFLARGAAEWEERLSAAGVPVGRINDLARVVEHPQVAARGLLRESGYPGAPSAKVVFPYFRLSDTPGALRAPAPFLGQHTDEVLEELLGVGEAERARLRAAGALGPSPTPAPAAAAGSRR